MTSGKIIIATAAALAVLCTPALALTMRQQHQQRMACDSLVTQKHPDLKGKAFSAEVKKCRADPEGYNSAG